jgi:peptide/nickel transport system substrate-binding protein
MTWKDAHSHGRLRSVVPGLAAAAVSLSLAFIGSVSLAAAQSEGETPKDGGTAVGVVGADPSSTNANIVQDVPSGFVGCMIHESLLRMGRGYELKPALAESWEISDEGKTYTFHLAEANFHDGQPVTSEDVKFTLEEVSAKFGPKFSRTANVIESVEAVDPRTVVIRLKQPFGPFLSSLTCTQNGSILPAHIFRGTDVLTNPASQDKPIGAGPFKLVEWVKGSHLRLTANEDYFIENEPHLDEIVVRIMPDSGARLLALQAGEADYIDQYYFPASSVALIEKDPRFQLMETRDPTDNLLMFNVKAPHLEKPEVRQALFQAIDRQYLLKNIWLGQGDVGRSSIDTRLKWAYNPAVDFEKMYPYDPEAAAKKLDEAGFPVKNGKRFTMRIIFDTARPEFSPLAQAIRSYWQAIGVETVLEGAEWAVIGQRAYKDYDFDAYLINYTTGGDPVLGIARAYVTSSIDPTKAYNNASRYSNPEVDKLFAEGEVLSTPEERAKPYFKAQEILARDMPVAVLSQAAPASVAISGLKNLWLSNDYQFWGSVWLDN